MKSLASSYARADFSTRVFHVLILLSWALWFGGMIALLLFVTRLFGVSHAVGFEAAPVLFTTFATYQLFVGMIACGAGTLLSLQTRRTSHALLSLLMILALAAALMIHRWTNQMNAIRLAGHSSGTEFKSLHKKSSIAYTAATGLLLVAGIGLIVTLPAPRAGRETAAG